MRNRELSLQKENENCFFLLFIYYKCNQRAHALIKPKPSGVPLLQPPPPFLPARPAGRLVSPKRPAAAARPSHPIALSALLCIRGERFAAHKPSRDCWCRLHRRWIRCRGRVLLLHNGGDQGTSLSFHLQQRPAREEGVGKMLVLPLCCD